MTHRQRTRRLADHLQPTRCMQATSQPASSDPLVVNPWPEHSMAPRDPGTPAWHTFGPASAIKSTTPVRVGDVVGGHVHPSLCVTQGGAVLAVYNEDGGGAAVLKICRSEDAGRTWSAPAPIPASANRSRRGVYPGSLSVLRSGRIVLQWAPYYENGEHQHGNSERFTLARDIGPGEVYRVPEYCISNDDGRTFGPTVYQIGPHHNLTNYSELRFPLVEQDDGTWILPFYDRTVAYDPEAGTVLPFGA